MSSLMSAKLVAVAFLLGAGFGAVSVNATRTARKAWVDAQRERAGRPLLTGRPFVEVEGDVPSFRTAQWRASNGLVTVPGNVQSAPDDWYGVLSAEAVRRDVLLADDVLSEFEARIWKQEKALLQARTDADVATLREVSRAGELLGGEDGIESFVVDQRGNVRFLRVGKLSKGTRILREREEAELSARRELFDEVLEACPAR